MLPSIAERLMRCPAAPYHEALVADEVRKISEEHGLVCRADTFGNLLVSLDTSSTTRPIIFAAHMDHPGFVIEKRVGEGRWKAQFLGGVPDSYFNNGVPVRLMPGNIPGKLGRKIEKKTFEILSNSAARPTYGVWDLRDFQYARERIRGRACDDLIGVASALAALIQLKRSRAKVNAIAAITRAEEVGFHGALLLAKSRKLPANALVISLETSREMPPVKMGSGVILRVGDRASVFDSTATRFLAEVAAEAVTKSSGFKIQRALMSGGACEGTAYQNYGFQTAALCVALGNYHNCATNNRIKEEFVSAIDAECMVTLLVHSARQMKNFERLTSKLPRKLEAYAREAKRKFDKYR